MGKSSRRTAASRPTTADADVPVVGQREPCPCGSGKKYKACHGRARAVAEAAAETVVGRPFEGLPGEPDWVALREVVPAATATLAIAPALRRKAAGDEPGISELTVATVLPLAWPAMRRADGQVFVGLQT